MFRAATDKGRLLSQVLLNEVDKNNTPGILFTSLHPGLNAEFAKRRNR